MQIRQKRAATKKNSFSEQSSITTNKEKGYSSSKNDLNEISRKISSSDVTYLLNQDSPAEFETTRATKPKLRNAVF